MGCIKVMSEAKIPQRIIMTDDPLRARVLISHNLEYSVPLIEQGDFFVFSGSYNGTPLAVVSTDFGIDKIPDSLLMLKEQGAMQVVYVSTCTSTTGRYDIQSMILGAGGSDKLIKRALGAAKRCGDTAHIAAILRTDDIHPEEGCIIDDATAILYTQASKYGFEALSFLTVSENKTTGAKMEENERRNRLYPASQLVFEMWAQQ